MIGKHSHTGTFRLAHIFQIRNHYQLHWSFHLRIYLWLLGLILLNSLLIDYCLMSLTIAPFNSTVPHTTPLLFYPRFSTLNHLINLMMLVSLWQTKKMCTLSLLAFMTLLSWAEFQTPMDVRLWRRISFLFTVTGSVSDVPGQLPWPLRWWEEFTPAFCPLGSIYSTRGASDQFDKCQFDNEHLLLTSDV